MLKQNIYRAGEEKAYTLSKEKALKLHLWYAM